MPHPTCHTPFPPGDHPIHHLNLTTRLPDFPAVPEWGLDFTLPPLPRLMPSFDELQASAESAESAESAQTPLAQTSLAQNQGEVVSLSSSALTAVAAAGGGGAMAVLAFAALIWWRGGRREPTRSRASLRHAQATVAPRMSA